MSFGKREPPDLLTRPVPSSPAEQLASLSGACANPLLDAGRSTRGYIAWLAGLGQPAKLIDFELLVEPNAARMRSRPPGGADAPFVTLFSTEPTFTGPLAALKQVAHESSRPGLRFYVRERQTKTEPTVRVDVASAEGRIVRSFTQEDKARRYIAELCGQPGKTGQQPIRSGCAGKDRLIAARRQTHR